MNFSVNTLQAGSFEASLRFEFRIGLKRDAYLQELSRELTSILAALISVKLFLRKRPGQVFWASMKSTVTFYTRE